MTMQSRPTVLFLFNSSEYAVRPWLDDGRFNVVSVDYSDTDHSQAHREPVEGHTVLNIDLGSWAVADTIDAELEALNMAQPSLVVSFAPCTDLAVSGAAHFKRKLENDPDVQHRAVRMARLVEWWDCPYAVENPVSVLASMWRKPDLYWHPYDFAHQCPEGPHPEFPEVIPERDLYPKKSCLWTGNGFRQPQKAPLPLSLQEQVKIVNPGHQKLGGKSAKTKYIRSLTPRGFAYAVYAANCDEILSKQGVTNQLSYGTIQVQQLELDV